MEAPYVGVGKSSLRMWTTPLFQIRSAMRTRMLLILNSAPRSPERRMFRHLRDSSVMATSRAVPGDILSRDALARVMSLLPLLKRITLESLSMIQVVRLSPAHRLIRRNHEGKFAFETDPGPDPIFQDPNLLQAKHCCSSRFSASERSSARALTLLPRYCGEYFSPTYLHFERDSPSTATIMNLQFSSIPGTLGFSSISQYPNYNGAQVEYQAFFKAAAPRT